MLPSHPLQVVRLVDLLMQAEYGMMQDPRMMNPLLTISGKDLVSIHISMVLLRIGPLKVYKMQVSSLRQSNNKM